MENLSESQLRRALGAAYELAELRDLAEFPARVAQLLHGLIGSEHAGYNAIDIALRRATVVADPPEAVFDGGPEALAQFGHQNPLIVRAAGGDTSVLQLSDHISHRQLHRTELYDLVYRVVGLEYQLGVQLPAVPHRLGRKAGFVGLSLCRTNRDFTAEDRAVLGALQPLLTATLARLQELALLRATLGDGDTPGTAAVVLVDASGTIAWVSDDAQRHLGLAAGEALPAALARWLPRRQPGPGSDPASGWVVVQDRALRIQAIADAYPDLDALHLEPVAASPTVDDGALRGLGLTCRQADVLALLLEGLTTREIAAHLQLSPRTVEKHLDGLYATLGVRTRSQAILAALRRLQAELPGSELARW
jgi:DNA-binding CsgD family transcriptional regulator